MFVSSRPRRKALLFSTLLLAALVILTGCPADGGGGNGNGGNGGNGNPPNTTPPDTTPPAQAVELNNYRANNIDLLFELVNPNSEAVQVGITIAATVRNNSMIEFDGNTIPFPTTMRISLAASGNTDATKQIRITGTLHNSIYTVTVTTFDESGNAHSEPATDTVISPPSAPPNLQFIARNGEVWLTWELLGYSPSYRIYRDGMPIRDIANDTNSYTNTGLTNDTTYNYTVQTVRMDGVESVDSPVVTATPSANLPAPPTGLSFSIVSEGVLLTWNAVAAAASYSVYRGGSTLLGTTTQTTYTDTGPIRGSNIYTVRILNNVRLESVNSNAVNAIIP